MTVFNRHVSRLYGAIPRRTAHGPQRAPDAPRAGFPLTRHAVDAMTQDETDRAISSRRAEIIKRSRRLLQVDKRRDGATAERLAQDIARLEAEVLLLQAREPRSPRVQAPFSLPPSRDAQVEQPPVDNPRTSASDELPVPLLSGVRTLLRSAPARDGQGSFRAAVLAAYGQCAVTGCTDTDVLEAAHIIPYVDVRSNLVINGICLRADIHTLFDRSKTRINDEYVVSVADGVASQEYRNLHGTRLLVPDKPELRPSALLLRARLALALPLIEDYLGGNK